MRWYAVEVMYLKEGCALSKRFWKKMVWDDARCRVSPDWMVHAVREDLTRFDEWITPRYMLKYRKVYVPVFDGCTAVLAQALSEQYLKDMNNLACRFN